jgi:hypothetical protein
MRKTITPPQLKKLHTLLSNAHMMDAKAELVHDYSNGRTTSSRELFMDEAQELITNLAKDDPCTKMRKKVIALCFELRWFQDGNDDEWQVNYAKLDLFLQRRGAVRKKFRSLTCKEVHKVLGQLEATLKHTRDSAERKKVDQDFNEVLAELGISRAKTGSERAGQQGGDTASPVKVV